jgi:hypothetical protein
MPVTAPPYALLACDVFAEELTALGNQRSDNGCHSNVATPWKRLAWLEMGLHDRPDVLRAEVQTVIDSWDDAPDFTTILLAYGLCGNGLLGIRARSKTLVLPRAHDCISILLGGRRAHEQVLKETPGTYFYSPGWIRGRRVPGPDREAWLRELYSARYTEDPDMVEELIEIDTETFTHHHCAAYVDITDNQEAENYCRNCAAFLGWEFRKLQGDADVLSHLLSGEWDAENFLIVPPGHRVEAASDSSIIKAVPDSKDS